MLGRTCLSFPNSTCCKLGQLGLQEITPTCASCWGYHDLAECCCGGDTPQDVVWKPSAHDPEIQLGTCPHKLCRVAAQQYVGAPAPDQHLLSAVRGLIAVTRRPQYSFEAEQSLFAPADISDAKSGRICTGVSGKGVPALPLGQPSSHTPEATLLILRAMGDAIRSRPAFADLFTRFEKDKLEFVKRAKPYMYVGTGQGIRSSFCACAKHKLQKALEDNHFAEASQEEEEEEQEQEGDDEAATSSEEEEVQQEEEAKREQHPGIADKLIVCDACRRLETMFAVWNGEFMDITQGIL